MKPNTEICLKYIYQLKQETTRKEKVFQLIKRVFLEKQI